MEMNSLRKSAPPDILSIALPKSCLEDELKLIEQEEEEVKDQLHIEVRRFAFPQAWPVEDVGIVYCNPRPSGKAPAIELNYCLVGNRYCSNPACQNSGCELSRKHGRHKPAPVMEVVNISYHPGLLKSFDTTQLTDIFETGNQYFKSLSPGTKTKIALEQLIHHPYKGVLKNIFLQSKGMELLLYSSDQFIKHNNQEQRYGCRFLTHARDREKIMKARTILTERLDSPVTIKELARMVAMNECYLKKGFKAMFGSTIYDYFQKERMERARYLLNDKGLPVSEVAVMMGYSCISHFSTAFKKHTGLKPCELLR